MNNYTAAVNPLTVEQAKQAVEGYLKNLNNSDLEIKESMIFNNNAYMRTLEKSTGIGTLAMLVDTSTLSVCPEYWANMIWNQKYGLICENGMMGGVGMISGHFRNSSSIPSKMTGTPEQTNQTPVSIWINYIPGTIRLLTLIPFMVFIPSILLITANQSECSVSMA